MQSDRFPLSERQRLFILIPFLILIIGGLVFAQFEYGLFQRIMTLIDENTPTGLFIALMLVLPVAGVPISLFLLVLGIKFGLIYGIALMEMTMPFHILLSYGLARTIRRPVEYLLVNRYGYRIPQVSPDKALMFSVVFLVFPGLPYAAKNFVLPLSGVPFRYCFWLNWAVQGVLVIPFIILGKSAADMDAVLFAVTILLFVILFFLLRWAQKRYRGLQQEDTP